MAKFDRTEEGHARAVRYCADLNRLHGRDYAIVVHREDLSHYSVGLASLVHKDHVADGTAANIVDKDQNFTPMFQGDD